MTKESRNRVSEARFFAIWFIGGITVGRWSHEGQFSLVGVVSIVISLTVVVLCSELFYVITSAYFNRQVTLYESQPAWSIPQISGIVSAVLLSLFFGFVPVGMIWRDTPIYTGGTLAVISLSTLFVILPHIALRRRQKSISGGSWNPYALLTAIALYYCCGIACVAISVADALVNASQLADIAVSLFASPFIGYSYGVLFLLSGSVLFCLMPPKSQAAPPV